MNTAILARLFQAHTDALQHAQHQEGQGGPLDLQQEPGALDWGSGQGAQGQPAPMSIDDMANDPGTTPPGQAHGQDDGTLPPSDYEYLDRVEGDGDPLGVMFGQEQGEIGGMPQHNVPMDQLPTGAKEGDYISPLDMKPTRMATRK